MGRGSRAGTGGWPKRRDPRVFGPRPAPQHSRVTAVVRWVRWVCGAWGPGPPTSLGEEGPEGCSPEWGSDFHECDLEAFHHALHVEDEGVLIRVVLNDVVVHIHQDAFFAFLVKLCYLLHRQPIFLRNLLSPVAGGAQTAGAGEVWDSDYPVL